MDQKHTVHTKSKKKTIIIVILATVLILFVWSFVSWDAKKRAARQAQDTPVPAKVTKATSQAIDDAGAGYKITILGVTKGIAIEPEDSKDDLWKGKSVVLVKAKIENGDKLLQRPAFSDMHLLAEKTDNEIMSLSPEGLFVHTYKSLKKDYAPLLVDTLSDNPNGKEPVEGYLAYIVDNSKADSLQFEYRRPAVSVIGTSEKIPAFQKTIDL